MYQSHSLPLTNTSSQTMATVQTTPAPAQTADQIQPQNGNGPPTYEHERTLPTQPVQPAVAQPFMVPAQTNNSNEKEPLAFLQPGQQPVPQMQQGLINTAVIADNAISYDAVRMSYAQYITIPKLSVEKQIPTELSSRGITESEYSAVITQVRALKSKSNTNKIALWTSCIFCCGIIGYLLVAQRAVGNKRLRKQLEAPLEEINRSLMHRGVPVRWLWVDGSLRAYYK
ncbi:uncharacterized protein FA14DRAFT_31890 [Meira miltonrushii]|uniref:Uncharacterized protein n=1 Tax=Meira miltonrushii TaxID=1280837 RepID=A0A316VAD9_9BASI|nr:uncharacterized protein FA14DRAFT_31890 [Meira miltonrushii]PWN34589.1 hypothetical protein FA14DRAFT_31890 [Meira miltonrushii]